VRQLDWSSPQGPILRDLLAAVLIEIVDEIFLPLVGCLGRHAPRERSQRLRWKLETLVVRGGLRRRKDLVRGYCSL
jgi:hypothetical protein